MSILPTNQKSRLQRSKASVPLLIAFTVFFTFIFHESYSTSYYASSVVQSSSGVSNASNAANSNPSNFATIQSPLLGITVTETITLDLNGTASEGFRAGFLLSMSAAVVGVNLFDEIKITTFLNGVEKENHVVAASLINAALLTGSTRANTIEFTAQQSFNRIRLTVNYKAGVTIGADLRVHYGYAVSSNILDEADGYLSRFDNPTTSNFSTAIEPVPPVAVCVNNDITNPINAVDNVLTNYASFANILVVGCPATLKVQLEGTAPATYYAGFIIGYEGLADIDVLSGLTITTYLNNSQKEIKTGFSLLNLLVLPDGKAAIYFKANEAFNFVEIKRNSLVGVLSNLQVYYGFGVEPSAFEGSQAIYSNFSNPANNSEYVKNNDALLCLGCDINNPDLAADADLENNFATITTGVVGALISTSLRLRLNGNGQSGNRAGVVLGLPHDLVNADLLNSLRLTTYTLTGDVIESARGSSLLQLSLLPNSDKYEVSFLTTQPFNWVEITFNEALSVLSDTRIYYAFADDRPLRLGNIAPIIPLPVELMFFKAQVRGNNIQLMWSTASEQDNSHFEIERSSALSKGFEMIGTVEGKGTTSIRQDYSFADYNVLGEQGGIYYYRLKQVDFDQTSTYSTIVAVRWDPFQEKVFTVAPNPAINEDHVKVRLNFKPEEGHQLLVYNISGGLTQSIDIKLPVQEVSVKYLMQGLYIAILIDKEGRTLGMQRLILAGTNR
jgi:hypothetical protein